MKNLLFTTLTLGLLLVCTSPAAEPEASQAPHNSPSIFITPLWGQVENDLASRDRSGQPTTLNDTGPMYGIHAVAFGRAWSLTDFLFFANVNNTDVSGNLFFANWYTMPEANISPNLGVGHLWHEIETQRQTIKINAPMLKAGILLKVPKLHLSLNPYTGYVWEGVKTAFSDDEYEYILYGLSCKLRWRMLYLSGKYYYQDNTDSDGEDFETYRLNATAFVHKHLGLTVRFDHMEHQGSINDSWLIGPTLIF